MSEPPHQYTFLPRIGVFCDQQQRSEWLLLHLQPLWITATPSTTNQYLLTQTVDIVLCWLDQCRSEYLEWINAASLQPDLFIIVIASQNSLESGELWLNAGAERFLFQPLSPAFLWANVNKAYQHLLDSSAARPRSENNAKLIWRLNCQEWQLSAPSGLSMTVTKLDMRFLQILMSAQGQILPRLQVARAIYVNHSEHELQRMEMLISRLRKKTRIQLCQDLPVKTSYADGLVFLANVQITPLVS